MNTLFHSAFASLVISLGLLPIQVGAQNKDQFRDQAKAVEAQMRAAGEPQDRCTLEAALADGGVVARTFGDSNLKPGDKLLVVNHVKVAGMRADDVIAVLRGIEPAALVPLTLDRQGELTDIDVQCSNARPTTEALLNGLTLAGRGKFDECVAVFAPLGNLDTRGAGLMAQCAALSRNAKKYNAPSLLVKAISMAIEDARFVTSNRVELVKQLRAMEGTIKQAAGASKYQELVAQTKAWPAGEGLYDSTAPDWALFRRNAEAALRARLIDPESARIDWTHGFLLGSWRPFLSKRIDGYWTCGLVNARNRMGGYTGSTSFVVVLDSNGVVQYSEIGESKDFDLLSTTCGNSAKLLPPPPAQLSDAANAPATASSSLADELKKLVDLKNSGALSEAEFQAAKARLLEGWH
jgi:hypothetical protein